MGDADAAFTALDNAWRSRYPFLWELAVDPAFDSIRGDARYPQLLRKLNL